MGLSSGDFADLTADLVGTVAPGRVLAFLEGGYDLEAIANSSAATIAALLGDRLHPESPTSGGPGGRGRRLGGRPRAVDSVRSAPC